MNSALGSLLASSNKATGLTRERESELARRALAGDRDAATTLVTANLHHVVVLARRRGRGPMVGDLVNEGAVGLLEALRNFDPTRGVRLRTYAKSYIRARILGFVARSWTVRSTPNATMPPVFFRLRSEHARAELLNGPHGDTVGAVAARLGVTRKKAETMLGWTERDVSLDTDDDGAWRSISYLRDEADPETAFARHQERAQIRKAVDAASAGFDYRERLITQGRLMGDPPMSLGEIGKHCGLSQERVRQIELQVKSKLKRCLLRFGVTCPDRAA